MFPKFIGARQVHRLVLSIDTQEILSIFPSMFLFCTLGTTKMLPAYSVENGVNLLMFTKTSLVLCAKSHRSLEMDVLASGFVRLTQHPSYARIRASQKIADKDKLL